MVSMGDHSGKGARLVKHPLKRKIEASNFDYGEYPIDHCSVERLMVANK